MKHVVLIGAIFFGYAASPLRAGSVITLSDGSELTGKLTLTATTLRVETSSTPTELNLSDILVANFGETPFQMGYFSSVGGGNQLPATWKAQDIGVVETPGSVVCADGTWTLTGSGAVFVPKPQKVVQQKVAVRVSDTLFFAGQPWTGNGQWTARVREIDAKAPGTVGGLMLRDSLEVDAPMFSLAATTDGNGGFGFRSEAGAPPQGAAVSMDLPIWLRLTRYGPTVSASISTDGTEWDLVGENNLKAFASPWIGIFAETRGNKAKVPGKVVIDQVSFTPPPSLAQTFPPGVLLQGGSFLAGVFNSLEFDPASPDATGSFNRSGKPVAIPRSKIAVVTMLPTARSQIADMSSHVGLLMKNGDVMDGDPEAINGSGVRVSSVLLGITNYNRAEVRACFLHPVQTQPANYEIRLRDGSIVFANDFSASDSEVVIREISGVNVHATPDEIAQIRAGPSQVQTMAQLNWKATPPPPAPAANAAPAVNPAPVANAAPAANAAPVANAAPAANAAPVANAAPAANAAPVANAAPEAPPVQCWEGNNQEQIMEASVGTTLEFPLTGKFRAVGVRIALSPDSPPNSNATIRVLADGREVARTPPFRAGDQPRFMEVTLQSPKTVTLEADSIFAGPKVLFIDPVAIR